MKYVSLAPLPNLFTASREPQLVGCFSLAGRICLWLVRVNLKFIHG